MDNSRKPGVARLAIAALVAPTLALVVFMTIASGLSFGAPRHDPPAQLLVQSMTRTFTDPLLVSAAYAIAVIVGLPVHFYLQRHTRASLLVYLAAGAFVPGLLAGLLWYAVAGRAAWLMSAAFVMPAGLTWAAVFWSIARPDRSGQASA